MKASNMKWVGVTGVLFILVLTAGALVFKQEQAAPSMSNNDEAKQAHNSANKAQASSIRQHRPDSPTRWVKSDEALKHRAAAKLALEKKLNQNRPVVSASSEKPVPVAKKPMRTIHPGAFYAYVPPPPGREDFGQWVVAKPIPESEITEKRQRLARGERLFERVIVRPKEISSAEVSGGMREVVSPKLD